MLKINVYHLNNKKYITIVPDRVYGNEILLGKSCLLAVCIHRTDRWTHEWKDDYGRYRTLSVAWVCVQGREHLKQTVLLCWFSVVVK